MTGWGLDGLADDISLVTTELVTNVVLHARSELEVVLEVGDRVRLEVHDRSPRAPTLRTVSELAMTGRGLRLVDLLASAWGAQPTAGGKLVWCEFALPAPNGGACGVRSADGTADPLPDPGAGGGRTARRGVGRLLARRLAGRRVA